MRERNSYSRIVQNVAGWTGLEKGKMIQLLHHCVENNISSFDNADFFARNYSDQKFGTALSESGLSRDEIQLISKYNSEDKLGLVDRIEQLLIDLDTDYLDLLLLDPSKNHKETHEAIAQLFSQGKITELGALNMNNSKMEETDIIFHAKQIGIPIQSFSDLKHIEPEFHPSEEIENFIFFDFKNHPKMAAFEEMCDKYEMTEDQLLLAWLLKHPAQLHPIINYTEKEEIAVATSIKENFLAPIDWQKINLMFT